MLDYSHILINSHLRSGGSLLARLFDGHLQLMAFPMEMRYSRRKVFWAEADDALRRKDLPRLMELFDMEWSFRDGFAEGVLAKDMHNRQRIGLSYDAFIEGVRDRLDGVDEWGLRNVLNAVCDSFFANWSSGEHYRAGGVKYLVNHMSMMCFANPSVFFKAYPDGFIVQTVRSPWAWYASMKVHFKVGDDEDIFLRTFLLLWFESTVRALTSSETFAGRYIMMRYEDLVADPESAMRELAARFDISFAPVLLEPTIGGKPWLGNAFDEKKHGVNAVSVEKWKRTLTEREASYIEDAYGRISACLGYGRDGVGPLGEKEGFFDDKLRLDIDFTPTDELQRLARENARMASILFCYHREFVEEYRRRERPGGLSRRLLGAASRAAAFLTGRGGER